MSVHKKGKKTTMKCMD